MDPIKCTYLFDGPEFRRAVTAFWMTRGYRYLPFVLLFLPILSSSDLFPLYQAHTLTWNSVRVSLASDLLQVVIFCAAMIPFMYLLQSWSFRGSSLGNKTMRYVIDDSGIHLDTGTMQTNLTWDAFASAYETKRGFMLYLGTGKRSFNWFPQKGFENADDVKRFRALLREKIPANRLKD